MQSCLDQQQPPPHPAPRLGALLQASYCHQRCASHAKARLALEMRSPAPGTQAVKPRLQNVIRLHLPRGQSRGRVRSAKAAPAKPEQRWWPALWGWPRQQLMPRQWPLLQLQARPPLLQGLQLPLARLQGPPRRKRSAVWKPRQGRRTGSPGGARRLPTFKASPWAAFQEPEVGIRSTVTLTSVPAAWVLLQGCVRSAEKQH